MKVTIVGGSQGTGWHLAKLALAAGHEVRVVSRSGRAPDGAEALAGDATDRAFTLEALRGSDAVVVTVGAAKGVRHQRALVTRAVVAAMQEAGVRRLLVQSSLGAGRSAAQVPVLLRWVIRAALAKPLADHNEQEAAVMASGLDWTIIRPTGLTEKPPIGTWRALEESDEGRLGGTIPRADLAAYMLQLLQDGSGAGKAVGISSYPRDHSP